MKTLYTFLFAFLAVTAASAQSLQLSKDSLTVTDADTNYLYAPVKVTNISGSTIEVMVKRTLISVVSGTENLFCWGATCYPEFVDTSTSPEILNSLEADSSFYGRYTPLDNSGISRINYTFYNKNNPADSVVFYVTYNATSTAIKESSVKTDNIKVYPNPATSIVTFFNNAIFEKNSRLKICNILGEELKTYDLSGASITVNVSDLTPGIYFYSLMESGKIVGTKKLVISR